MAVTKTQTQISPLEIALLEEEPAALNQLIVYNDDVNTFDHVIETLMSVCQHTPEQAEQCTLLIHFKGKCTVKEGSFIDLLPLCSAIQEKGLSADIQ